MIRLKPLGLAALFLLGIFCIYLGFSGVLRPGSKQQQAPPQQKSGVVEVAGQGTGSAFFVTFRQEREIQRQQQRDLLNELLNNSNTAADTRKAAQKQMLELAQIVAKEGEIENQALSKGFKDAVATINNAGVTLTVFGSQFSTAQITQLQDIAVRTSGVRLENVIIVPHE